jgi:hypothetical protein
MTVKLRRWLVASLGAAILVVAAVAALRATQKADARGAPAAVSPTCSSRLLTDWSDGSLDGTYPIRCYRDTLKSLPADLRIYSSAPDDIAQALSKRIQSRAARTLAGAKRG